MSEPKLTNIFLYGKGVFTTVAFSEFQLFLWEKHWNRLIFSAAKLGIDISSHSERVVNEVVLKAINENPFSAGRVRITFLDESSSSFWGDGIERHTSLSIVTAERRLTPGRLNLTVSPHLVNTTSPLAGIKSCNYLEPLMALGEAKGRGFVEAMRLNERGEIASACMANVFWLKGDELFTPSLRTGCLPGTTREYILENLECKEVEEGIDAVQGADEIFLTSAGLGVVQVNELDGRPLGKQHHGILDLIPRPA